MPSEVLDNIDRDLLRILQADGKASVQDLADATGLSTSPCWRRVKRLEDAGLITGYGAIVSAKAIGLRALAYVHVSLIDHRQETVDAFSRLVDTRDQIVECASITGSSDYVLKIAAADAEGLERFIMQVLLRSGLVRTTQTNFIMRQTKSTRAWPVGPLA